jgi:hypothetical protein
MFIESRLTRVRLQGVEDGRAAADSKTMIWPVAALAGLFLCFVVVYGTRLQARIEAQRNTR